MRVFCCCCSSKKHGWGRPLPGRRIRQLGESGSGLDVHIWRNIRFVQWQDHSLSSVITSKMSTPAMWYQLPVCACSKTSCFCWCNKQTFVTEDCHHRAQFLTKAYFTQWSLITATHSLITVCVQYISLEFWGIYVMPSQITQAIYCYLCL